MDPRQRLQLQHRLARGQAWVWLVLGFLALAYGRLQILKRSELQALALQQAVKVRATPAPRGIIFDRNGHKLVDNRRALHLVLQREDVPKDPQRLEEAAAALELEPELLNRRAAALRSAPGNRALVLRDNLDEEGIAQAEMLRARFPFLSIQVAPRRVYQGDELAGHVLGYVAEVGPEEMAKDPGKYQLGEIIGRTGVEATHNDHIRGLDGQRRILVDQLGREVSLYGQQEPQSGRNVYLTLDAGLQQVIAAAFGQERGSAIVLDLRDGGILAMVSSPSYDPNIFLDRLSQEMVDKYIRNPVKPMVNRSIQGRYPPGSTYKLLVALSALEKGIITAETRHHCAGRKSYYGHVFRCDGIHGTVDLIQAIAVSCDIYFYELGARLDVDEIYATAEKYGLTVPTGVDLPHELASRIPNRAWKAKVMKKDPKWYAGETISVSIGQGANHVTPIALARFYALLATKGKLLTPHLLYGFRNEQTNQIDPFPSSPPQDTRMDPRIAGILDLGLSEVMRIGTARAMGIPGLNMCGKTGTSQVAKFVDKAHYAKQAKELKDNALFAGYAPRENPQIAWAIVVENAGFGATSAAPIAKKLCQYWFYDRLNKPLPAPGGKLPDAYPDAESKAEEAP